MLHFKKKFLDAILSGAKAQTIRLWSRPRFRADQVSYIPGAGYIRILSVDPIALGDLTDDDAHLDGVASVAALRREIRRLYPQPRPAGLAPYRLRFQLMSDHEVYICIRKRERVVEEKVTTGNTKFEKRDFREIAFEYFLRRHRTLNGRSSSAHCAGVPTRIFAQQVCKKFAQRLPHSPARQRNSRDGPELRINSSGTIGNMCCAKFGARPP